MTTANADNALIVALIACTLVVPVPLVARAVISRATNSGSGPAMVMGAIQVAAGFVGSYAIYISTLKSASIDSVFPLAYLRSDFKGFVSILAESVFYRGVLVSMLSVVLGVLLVSGKLPRISDWARIDAYGYSTGILVVQLLIVFQNCNASAVFQFQ